MVKLEKGLHRYLFPIISTKLDQPDIHIENYSALVSDYDFTHSYDFLVVDEMYEDGIPLVGWLSSITKSMLVTVLMTSLLIGSYFKSIMYRYVLTTKKENRSWLHRPINVLIIHGAIIHHVTHVGVGIWYSMILVSETHLSHLFGYNFCEFMDIVGLYGLGYLTVGSLGIALFRVLYIKRENWVRKVIGEKRLLIITLSASHIVGAILLFLFKIESSSDRFHLNMCRGISVSHSQILIDYNLSKGSNMFFSSYFRLTSLACCVAIQTVEFSIYIWFFVHRYKSDNGNIRKLLTHDVLRERNMKNMQTFLGQFYGFIMEYAYLISILFLILFADSNTTPHIKALVNIAKIADFGLLSAVEVLSSPGMRAFMKSI